jgi:hypothetical protein
LDLILNYTLGRMCSLFYVFIIHCSWYDILLHAVKICRSTSITANVELLGYFILVFRWICYIYCCLDIGICLKLELQISIFLFVLMFVYSIFV